MSTSRRGPGPAQGGRGAVDRGGEDRAEGLPDADHAGAQQQRRLVHMAPGARLEAGRVGRRPTAGLAAGQQRLAVVRGQDGGQLEVELGDLAAVVDGGRDAESPRSTATVGPVTTAPPQRRRTLITGRRITGRGITGCRTRSAPTGRIGVSGSRHASCTSVSPCRRVTSTARPGGRGPGPRRADERPLVATAVPDQPRRRELAQPGEHRLEHRPRGAARAPRDDEVQPDVLGLGEQVDQRSERVARGRGDEVVVVDEQEHLGPGPPGAGAQLLRGDVGPGQPLAAARPPGRSPPRSGPRPRRCS